MKHAELAVYLVNAPLYQPKEIEDAKLRDFPHSASPNYRELFVPTEVRRDCATCGGERSFEFVAGGGFDKQSVGAGLLERTYRCKDCESGGFSLWLTWWVKDGKVFIVKAGQYPKLEVTLPSDFEKALGAEKAAFYRRGMTSRHNGYGIGALAYFRRVIESTVDDMLKVLEEAMVATDTDPAAIERLRTARGGREFEDKVKLAAEVIPEHLKPGGKNPFADLHGLLSIGLHGLSDEDCCDIVTLMDEPLKYVYTTLRAHTESASRYRDAANKINQAVGKFRGRAARKPE